jgi:hypothetical protein
VIQTHAALADASSRNIFWERWIKGSPWFSSGTTLAGTIYGFYDPWIQDMSPAGLLPDPTHARAPGVRDFSSAGTAPDSKEHEDRSRHHHELMLPAQVFHHGSPSSLHR